MSYQSNGTQKSQPVLLGSAQDIGYGQRRTRLEDRLLAEKIQTKSGLEIYLGVVADGVGGANAGERAAEIVIETVRAEFLHTHEHDINTILVHALSQAQKLVREEAKSDPRVRSMSTTASVAVVHQHKLFIAHIGDSRIYLIRKNTLRQLTIDHNWGNEKILEGKFTSTEIAQNPRRQELARYIGQPVPLQIDIGIRFSGMPQIEAQFSTTGFPLLEGDVVLLCTDGLIKEKIHSTGCYVEPEEMINTVTKKRNAPQDMANTLVSIALGRKTDDNVSVVVIEIASKPTRLVPGFSLFSSAYRPVLAFLGGLIMMFFVWRWIFLGRNTTVPPVDIGMHTQVATTNISIPGHTPVTSQLDGGNDSLKVIELNGQVFFQGGGQLGANRLLLGQTFSNMTEIEFWTGDGQANQLHLESSHAKILIFGSNTHILLQTVIDTGDTKMYLRQGSILLIGEELTVQAFSRSFLAHLTKGILAIEYMPASGEFTLDCLEGNCLVSDGLTNLFLSGGQQGKVYKGLILETIMQANYTPWLALASKFVPTPTYTPSPTATNTATLTPTFVPTIPWPTSTLTPRPPKESQENTPVPPTITPTETLIPIETPVITEEPVETQPVLEETSTP